MLSYRGIILILATTGTIITSGTILVASSSPLFAQVPSPEQTPNQTSPVSNSPEALPQELLSRQLLPQKKEPEETISDFQNATPYDQQKKSKYINSFNENTNVITEQYKQKNLVESIKQDKKAIAEQITDLAAIIAAQNILKRAIQDKSKTDLLPTSLCDKSPLKGDCSKLTGTFSKLTSSQKTVRKPNGEDE